MQPTREEIFDIWVPAGGLWTPWGIPVLFSQLPEKLLDQQPAADGIDIPSPAEWFPRTDDRRVVILDIAGPTAVAVGLSLAKFGFRPVPLFNGCHGDHAVIDQGPILQALIAGVTFLSAQRIADTAPPVFLLDSGRMNGLSPIVPRMFDNRWKIFPQDFPDAEFLLQHEWSSCLVVQETKEVADDLCHVLRRWQSAGLTILRQVFSNPAEVTLIDVPQPPNYRNLWYRAIAQQDCSQGLQGGFGFIVPEPRSG